MSRGRNGNGTPAPPARRCAIYTRKSTSEGLDQEFNSLDAQREACERYIAAREHDGWSVVDGRYDDGGFTGANLERPAFQRLMADVEARKLDVVVVYKVDRLSRSLLDFAQVMDRFNKADVAFVSVTQNFSTADAMGRLTLNMLMSFAEFEREMIAERTRDKIAAARRRGKWTGGPVPLGYDVVEKKLVVNDLEAVVVSEVFDLYLEHASALTVTTLLNDRGRMTKRHQAQNGNVRKARPWTKDAVLRILRNPVYAGLMPCGDDLNPAEHEAIVPRETWERVQVLLDGRNRPSKQRPQNPDYLLRGLLRCGCCGLALTPASTTKNGCEYRYYRSITRDKKGKGDCLVHPLAAGAIEDLVIDQIRKATADGRLADDVLKKVTAAASTRRRELEKEHAGLPAAIATLAAEGQALARKVAETTGPAVRLLDERLQEVGGELARRERRLAEVERALAALDEMESEAAWVASVLRDFDALWDVMNPANRYRLVHALVREIVIDDEAGTLAASLVDFDEPLEIGPSEAAAPAAPVSAPRRRPALHGGEVAEASA